MLSEREAIIPMVLSVVRDILVADLGALDDFRCEFDEVVLTFEGRTVRAPIPEVDNVFEVGKKVADDLISRLNR